MARIALQVAQAGAARRVRVLFYGELEAATAGFSNDRRIGGGGFGSVFKAVGLSGLGECAVKRLDEGSTQGQLEFLQEVQVLGGCRHENLMPLFGLSADRAPERAGGSVCLVSPLMRGGRYARTAPRAARTPELLAWDVRLRIGAEIGSALEYLHTAEEETRKPQVFHRDVKPANVLLDADLHARLGDVGLARALEVGEHISTLVAGTPAFIDPNYQVRVLSPKP
ncbi:kinase-like domain-containing protein [Baffinella frigidus]|nr:kinase-like domain-containing protein [Cryptophyta sp. CCMP2293]